MVTQQREKMDRQKKKIWLPDSSTDFNSELDHILFMVLDQTSQSLFLHQLTLDVG
jgi:hypothetical protein